MVLIGLDDSKVSIVKLESTPKHKALIKDFDCGDPDLNEFIKEDAFVYMNGKIAVTYILSYEKKALGFFCLSNDSIEITGKAKDALVKEGKRQKTYPALKIGRLGVHKENQGKGFGTFIIRHTLGLALTHSEKIGCRYLTVDAYNRDIPVNFYSSKGFQKMTKEDGKENVPMYLDLLKYVRRS
jgi:GNAT superfamily N-acetyltransferase